MPASIPETPKEVIRERNQRGIEIMNLQTEMVSLLTYVPDKQGAKSIIDRIVKIFAGFNLRNEEANTTKWKSQRKTNRKEAK